MLARALGSRRAARIDHDQDPAAGPLSLEVLHERRHRLGDVRADEENHARVRNVLQRERQSAIETERHRRSRGARGHAEAAVVIDVRRPQCHARKFPEQIRLFVRERAAAEDADGIMSAACLDFSKTADDEIERLVPARAREASCSITDKRRPQSLGMVKDVCRRPSLHAQAALIDRKVRVAGDGQAVYPVRPDVHAALKSAVRTVGRKRRRAHACLG